MVHCGTGVGGSNLLSGLMGTYWTVSGLTYYSDKEGEELSNEKHQMQPNLMDTSEMGNTIYLIY